MYIIIIVQTFRQNQDSVTEANFDHIIEFLLLILGPYAVSIFLKANNGNFLSDENKSDIKKAFDKYLLKHVEAENDIPSSDSIHKSEANSQK